jgi:transposase
MWAADTEARWQQLAEEVWTGMKEWRLQHPKATLREIEAALDERLARVRARMLQDVALASAVADLRAVPAAERPRCPACGQPLEARGQEARHLTTTHEQQLTLRRHYAVCPACDTGLFPPG